MTKRPAGAVAAPVPDLIDTSMLSRFASIRATDLLARWMPLQTTQGVADEIDATARVVIKAAANKLKNEGNLTIVPPASSASIARVEAADAVLGLSDVDVGLIARALENGAAIMSDDQYLGQVAGGLEIDALDVVDVLAALKAVGDLDRKKMSALIQDLEAKGPRQFSEGDKKWLLDYPQPRARPPKPPRRPSPGSGRRPGRS